MKIFSLVGATLVITLGFMTPALAETQNSEPQAEQVVTAVEVVDAEQNSDESTDEELSDELEVAAQQTEIDAVIAAADEYLAQFENIRVVSIAWVSEAYVVAILADKPEQESVDYLKSLGVVVRVIDIDTPFDEARYTAAIDRFMSLLSGRAEYSAGFNVDTQNRQIVISCDKTTSAFLTEMLIEDPDFGLIRFELSDWGPALDDRGVVLESSVDPSVIRSTDSPVAIAYQAESTVSPTVQTVVAVPGVQVGGDSFKSETKPKSVDQAPTLTASESASPAGYAIPLIALLAGLAFTSGRLVLKRFKKLS